MNIVPMVEGDLAEALAIDHAAFEGDASVREQQLREELSRTWARLRVARSVDDELIGYVLFWHVADEIHLLNVAVKAERRRGGVGTALVNEVVAYGRAHSAAKVLLEVRRSNHAAIAMYERLGFAEFNVRAKYYPDGEDGIEMMIQL